jgi:L-ascorbate metabolism protein UlaG (beta-lactamase superfamily)
MPTANYVLATHGHYDHFDIPSLSVAARDAHVLTPLGYDREFRSIKTGRRREMMIVHWGTFRLGDEPVHFPPIDIQRALETAGLHERLIDLPHGYTYKMA